VNGVKEVITINKKTVRKALEDEAKTLYAWWTMAEMAQRLGTESCNFNSALRRMIQEGKIEVGSRKKADRGRWLMTYRATTGTDNPPAKPTGNQHDNVHDNVFRAIIRSGHDEDFSHKPASQPTRWPCGSPEKVEVMRIRISLGQDPFHPGDNPATDARRVTDGGNPSPPKEYSIVFSN
jgi:hypothetical protein